MNEKPPFMRPDTSPATRLRNQNHPTLDRNRKPYNRGREETRRLRQSIALAARGLFPDVGRGPGLEKYVAAADRARGIEPEVRS